MARIIPFGKAVEMILTGKRIDAYEACTLNLVNKVVPLKDLMTTAKELAVQLCDSAPLAIQAAKEALYRGLDMTLLDGLKLESELSGKAMTSRDFAEGRTAFIEKRKPNYTGE